MSRWADEKKKESVKGKKEDIPTLADHEQAVDEAITELQQAFRDRNEKEQSRFKDVCDSNYYFVVCFSNRPQMEEFCKKVGLDSDEIYIDGREFAKKIGKALEKPDTEFPKTQAFSKSWTDRAMKK